MTAVPDGPCAPWCDWGALSDLPGGCDAVDAIGDNVTLQAQILAAASRRLWLRTCEQYGECTITRARIMPTCRHHRHAGWRSGQYGPYGGQYAGGCCSGGGHYLFLGDTPIVSITTVWEDGVELDPGSYRVDDWARLVRTDGQPWRNGAALDAGEGETGTVEVTYVVGVAVPLEGSLYAAMLACKIAGQVVADCGASPSNAVSIASEGETIVIEPSADSTGIAIIESWLSTFQCGGGSIFDPAGDRAVVRRGT